MVSIVVHVKYKEIKRKELLRFWRKRNNMYMEEVLLNIILFRRLCMEVYVRSTKKITSGEENGGNGNYIRDFRERTKVSLKKKKKSWC